MKAIAFVAAALAVLTSAAGAQNMKPGLWEVQSKVNLAGGGEHDSRMAAAQQEMANLPPEQRKMVEQMMAQRGIKMGDAPGSTSVKVCVSREMAERNEVPTQRGDCKTTTLSRTGNTMKMAFQCASPPSSGEGQITFASSEAYAMKMAVTTTLEGKPEKVTMDGAGKWLGADCGSVKPFTLPK